MKPLKATYLNVWQDIHGTVKPIDELETSHIENILKGFLRGNPYYGQGNKVGMLLMELEKRYQVKLTARRTK